MVKLTGSPNYKMPEIARLLTVVEELLPLGRDEWERVTIAYNTNRNRSWAERDLDSLRRKFKALYSARKPTGSAEMPAHIKQAKLTKLAIDDKANVVEMDDVADQDEDEDQTPGVRARSIAPDFSFEPFFDDEEGHRDGNFDGTEDATTGIGIDIVSTSLGSDTSHVGGSMCADAVDVVLGLPNQAPTVTCDFQPEAEGLEAFGPVQPPASIPTLPRPRQLRSSTAKKADKSPVRRMDGTPSSCTPPTPKAGKSPVARCFLTGSQDEQEAQRHPSLQSASNRLGGNNLYTFRDTVGIKRARDGDDREHAEASFAKAKRMRALKKTAALKQKLVELETSSKSIGNSTFEMLLMFREDGERKAEIRRIEEDRHRREAAAAIEARLLAEKLEGEDRRRQDKIDAEERARPDKEDARARMQEMFMFIGALFKKE